MEWKELSQIKKFTPLIDVFEEFGKPMFQFSSRPVYYLGEGFLISYSQKMFEVKNDQRIEFGDEGEYALNLYYFSKKQELESYFKVKNEQFGSESEILGECVEIFDEVNTDSTYEKVVKYCKPKSTTLYYQEGETKSFQNGVFSFQNTFIACGNYIFLFFGKSKKTKLSGFEFTLI